MAEQQTKSTERKVMIAVDGSKQSDLAFKWYLDNCYRPGDKVFIIHGAEYKVDVGMPGAMADVDGITKAMKSEDDRITNLTGGHTDTCKKQGILANALIIKGSKPGEAIINAANKNTVDMIIMGSRGLGLLRRTVLGSVSEYVIHHAPAHCAVVILRDS